MPSLLDLMQPPAIRRPVDPHGDVIQGRVNTRLVLEHPRGMAWAASYIELHPSTDGLWMWSTGKSTFGDGGQAGSSYRVGEKWGNFAESKAAALYWATREIEDWLDRWNHNGPNAKRLRAWLLDPTGKAIQ